MRLVSASLLAALVAAVPSVVAAQGSIGLRSSIPPDRETGEPDEPAAFAPRPVEDEDPYAPLGIRAGGLLLFPALTATLGYTSNADAAPDGAGAAFGVLMPELLIRSDWARHEATVRVDGSYEQYFDGSTGSPSGSAEATARIDLADGWASDLAAGYTYAQQSTSDPDFPAGADNSPGVHRLIASLGLSGRVGGRGVFAVEGDVERGIYENAIVGGVPVDEGDRNNTAFTARLRAGYEATPSLTPFVEGEISRRLYDRVLDDDGLARSSVGHAWRVGVAFGDEPFLSGEVAVGYAEEAFDDPALAALRTLTVEGSLVWAPTTLTTVTINGATSLQPAADPASSGSIVHDGSVDLAYAWRRNVTLTGTAGARREAQQGTGLVDSAYSAGFSATWKMNRTHHFTAGYLHEWQESTDPTRTYQSDAVRVELRMQR